MLDPSLKSSSGPCLKFVGYSCCWTEGGENNIKHALFILIQLAKFMECQMNDDLTK